MRVRTRRRVPLAVPVVAGALCVVCASVQIPPPVNPGVEQATTRGRSAPEPDKLAAAVFGHVLGEWSRAGHRLPAKVCVGVSAGLSPPGWETRLDCQIDWAFLADADVSSLQQKYPSGPTFVGISACGWEAGGDAWVIVLGDVERWWDSTDEYDALIDFLWWEQKADEGLVPRQDQLRCVAVHGPEGWRVLRGNTGPRCRENP